MESIKINLATFEYQDKRISYPVMLLAASIVLIISILSIRGSIDSKGEIKKYEKKILKQEQNIMKGQQTKEETITRLNDVETESLKEYIDFVNGLIKMDAYPYDRLLNSLELCMPKGSVLSDFKISKDLDIVILKGKAASIAEVTVLIKGLDDSRIYKNINLLNLSVARAKSPQEGPVSGENGITFEIECSIDKDQIWVESKG